MMEHQKMILHLDSGRKSLGLKYHLAGLMLDLGRTRRKSQLELSVPSNVFELNSRDLLTP